MLFIRSDPFNNPQLHAKDAHTDDGDWDEVLYGLPLSQPSALQSSPFPTTVASVRADFRDRVRQIRQDIERERAADARRVPVGREAACPFAGTRVQRFRPFVSLLCVPFSPCDEHCR